ncbi:4-hydroxy-3-methylbut-2-enyl diphosphate reductase [Streptomyces sp. NPDC057617]|uniref:4-hydroxy-3-methylbut-2-enyl diphosphate reductase n=1 Tax=Streptomyces sp. NPDC057617 TaxID=3346184 RepID=UPI0036B00EC8
MSEAAVRDGVPHFHPMNVIRPAGGGVLVADRLRLHGGLLVPCRGAPLLLGSLTRKGIRARTAELTVADDTGGGSGASGGHREHRGLWTEVPVGTSGSAPAMALAAATDDPAELPVLQAALDTWRSVCRPRTVLLAAPRSFCAGVERAIEVVERLLERRTDGTPVHVRKQIVHNTHVVRELEERGAVFVDELDAVPDGATVVFSAHGVSPQVRRVAAERGLDVVDATCPLVTKVHGEARRFAERGDTVLLIGHAGHEETEGTAGEAPGRTVLVESVRDAETLRVPDPYRVSYLTQTTLAMDETADIIAALRQRFPHLRGPGSEDICYATTNRQRALEAVAADADLVLVVGSANSSNSVRLAELAERHGTPAELVDSVADIRPEDLAGAATVGLTAGASAPPSLVDDVLNALSGLGPTNVEERETAVEDVRFAPPRTVTQ